MGNIVETHSLKRAGNEPKRVGNEGLVSAGLALWGTRFANEFGGISGVPGTNCGVFGTRLVFSAILGSCFDIESRYGRGLGEVRMAFGK